MDLANAEWSTKHKNDLPDSCFAYVEPGGETKDGVTTPKSLRHYPIKGPDGKYDHAHVANAAARAAAAIKAGGKEAEIARKALPKIREAEKALKMGEHAVAKSEAVQLVWQLANAEGGVASPLVTALGEDAARAVLALAQAEHTEISMAQLALADEAPTKENPDPDGDGDDDSTPQGDTDHDYWNADGTPTAKGRSVGFTAEQGKAMLSKSEDRKMSEPTAEALAKSEKERIAMAEEMKALREKLANTEAIANAEREARVQREYLAKAEAYKHVPGISQEDLAQVLRTVEEANPEVGAKLATALQAAEVGLAKSELFREMGSSANRAVGTGALAQMEALATQLAKSDNSITHAQAMARVQAEHPELYQQYKVEQQRAAREA